MIHNDDTIVWVDNEDDIRELQKRLGCETLEELDDVLWNRYNLLLEKQKS